MTSDIFTQLDELKRESGPAAALDKLVETLRERKDYFNLFDALLLKRKFAMGLPLTRPTAIDDVAEEQRPEFEQAYVDAAREVGMLFLAAGDIPQAWPYLRTVRETDAIRAAIDEIDVRDLSADDIDDVINVALYEGGNPSKGLEMVLAAQGTCNAVTAFDQVQPRLSAADRKQAVRMLVRHLYDELCEAVRYHVEQRVAVAPPGDSLRESIAGRDWLFGENSQHIDGSHLSGIVRFARDLEAGDAELDLAMQLAEYGAQLDESVRYPGDPPFEDFYPAHIEFFRVISGKNVDEGLNYFRNRLEAETDERDQRLTAFVLVDLLVRAGRETEAVETGERFLRDLDDAYGFSFAELCRRAGKRDVLLRVSRENGDLIRYTAALVDS